MPRKVTGNVKATRTPAKKIEKLQRELFERVWNGRERTLIGTLFAPEGAHYGLRARGLVSRGPTGVEMMFDEFTAAFPDLMITIDDMISNGKSVATRYTLTGTHRTKLWGIPASGNRISIMAMNISRWEKGKCVESRTMWEQQGLLVQMQKAGATTSPGTKPGDAA